MLLGKTNCQAIMDNRLALLGAAGKECSGLLFGFIAFAMRAGHIVFFDLRK